MAADGLDTALGFFGQLPQGSLVIIKDSLAASGSFLLHHYISRMLAAPKAGTHAPTSVGASTIKSTVSDGGSGGAQCKVCLVAFDQMFSHYANVGRKQGANHVAAAQEGALRFVDGVSKAYEWGHMVPESTSGGLIETSEGLESFLEGRLQGLSIRGMPPSVKSASPSAPDSKAKQTPDSSRVTPPSVATHSQPDLQTQPGISSTGLSHSSHKMQPSHGTALPHPTFTCHICPPRTPRKQSPFQTLCHQISVAVSNHSSCSGAEEKQSRQAQPSAGGLAIVFDDLGGPEAACQGSVRELLVLLNWCRTLQSQSGEVSSLLLLGDCNESNPFVE